jgi:hypothetical protein
MHHCETSMPGTLPALVLIAAAALVLAAGLIGGLYGLSAGFNWLLGI